MESKVESLQEDVQCRKKTRLMIFYALISSFSLTITSVSCILSFKSVKSSTFELSFYYCLCINYVCLTILSLAILLFLIYKYLKNQKISKKKSKLVNFILISSAILIILAIPPLLKHNLSNNKQ